MAVLKEVFKDKKVRYTLLACVPVVPAFGPMAVIWWTGWLRPVPVRLTTVVVFMMA